MNQDNEKHPRFVAFGRGFVWSGDDCNEAAEVVKTNGNGCIYFSEHVVREIAAASPEVRVGPDGDAERFARQVVGSAFDNTAASHETLKATMIERIADAVRSTAQAGIPAEGEEPLLSDYVSLLERNNGRLREVLKEALDQTGCDGDLCNYRWHEKARILLGEESET